MNTANWGGNVGSSATLVQLSETIRIDVVLDDGTRLPSQPFNVRTGHRGQHAAALLVDNWNADLTQKAICMAVANGGMVHFAGTLTDIMLIRGNGAEVSIPVGPPGISVLGSLRVWAT